MKILNLFLGISFVSVLLGIPSFVKGDETTTISVMINGDSTIYLDSTNRIIRATVTIENYDPRDGYYFMSVVQKSTGKTLTTSEIYPKDRGNDIWGTQIAYMVKDETEDLVGDYEIRVATEFGTATAKTTFSVVESKPKSPEETRQSHQSIQADTTQASTTQASTTQKAPSGVMFRDSTGYIPSWAENMETYSVLTRCQDLVGGTSKDGNWCYEWTAYVVQQGEENFPESSMGQKENFGEPIQIRSDNSAIGLKEGQWVRYKLILNINSDPSLENTMRSLIPSATQSVLVEAIESIDWIELKIEKIEGNEVTFSKTTSRNGKTQSEPLVAMIQNSRPGIVIETDVSLGHTLQTPSGFAPLTLVEIKNLDSYILYCGIASDLCEGKNVETLRYYSSSETIQGNLEVFTEADYIYERSSGMLFHQILTIDICTLDYSACGHLEVGVIPIDFSKEGFTIIPKFDPYHPSKYEIMKKLSEFLVKDKHSRYLFTNEQVSFGQPTKTTYDIILTRDNSNIGVLTIHGDKAVSKISSSTFYNLDKRNVDDANDIHQIIRMRLIPNCCGGIDNHNFMWLNNDGKGIHSNQKIFGSIGLSLGVSADEYRGTGIFTQEIAYNSPSLSTFISEKLPTEKDQVILADDSVIVEQDGSDNDVNPAYVALGAFIILGIPAIIIGLIIWKIKKRRAVRILASNWKGV